MYFVKTRETSYLVYDDMLQHWASNSWYKSLPFCHKVCSLMCQSCWYIRSSTGSWGLLQQFHLEQRVKNKENLQKIVFSWCLPCALYFYLLVVTFYSMGRSARSVKLIVLLILGLLCGNWGKVNAIIGKT